MSVFLAGVVQAGPSNDGVTENVLIGAANADFNAWFTNLWANDGCNVKNSDFSIATFNFDTDKNEFSKSTSSNVDANAVTITASQLNGYKLNALACKWKYDGATETTSTTPVWTKPNGIPKVTFAKAFALKLRNEEVTSVTATCDLWFHHDIREKRPALFAGISRVFALTNCDVPRLNSNEMSDQGRFIKDACANTWPTPGNTQNPAPFQACGGAMVFPSNATTPTTNYLDQATDLACCAKKTAYNCAVVPGSTIKRCTEQGPAPAMAFAQAFSSPLVMVGLCGMAALVVVVAKKHQTATADDGYVSLLH
ncbi:hypothetical protein B5M09_011095 [Aphanomyces astaci]|nr:hypothetical protein B5M09_011095 [Aphanomyces astaci]